MINMMTRVFLALVLICILWAVPPDIWAAIGDWHNYTYSKNCTDIISDGQDIWCTSTGGLIRYNTVTGETRKYLNSDGLGDINIYSIEIDSAGSVFLGGNNGTLTKIATDGTIRYEEFEYDSEIRYILLDLHADGDILWVATEVGVSKFLIDRNGGEFKETYDHFNDIPLQTPTRAVLTIGEYLWAGTDSGLAYIEKNDENPQVYTHWSTITRGQNGLTEPKIRSMSYALDTLFIGTTNGVFWMDADSIWHNIGPTGKTIYSLKHINGIITAAANDGVYTRADGNWARLSIDSLTSTQARGITNDSQGNIWAAFTEGGFGRFNDNYWEIVTVPGPAANYINDLAIDSSGNVWLVHTIPGYGGQMGVSKFDGVNWYNYNYRNSGIGTSGAVAVEYDDIHHLVWFGSWGDGLFSFDGDTTWQNFDENNSPLRGVQAGAYYVVISDIFIDDQGYVWALNLKAYNPEVVMAVYNPDPLDSEWLAYYQNPEQVADNWQQVIYVADNITYVCGEHQNIQRVNYGADVFDSTDDQWLEKLTGVDLITDLQLDNSGLLYAGTGSGLAKFNGTNLFWVDLPDDQRTAVRSLALDGLGNKWVATDSGVAELAGITWKSSFRTANSFLLDNSVRSIEVDKRTGFVYIGTSNGLSIYESGAVAPSPDLHDMAVYPNPVFARDEDARVNFLRVPADAEIYIYNAAGDLIKEIDYSQENSWDLRNEARQKVAAGIYVFYVRAKISGLSGTGKFAIIR